MGFEFAFLDWMQGLRSPVMDALAIFFNWAGMHGELWILLGLALLAHKPSRRAGLALLLALLLYLVVGDMVLKPFFARARPCDINTAAEMLVARPNGHSFPSGHTSSAFAAAAALAFQKHRLGPAALGLAAFIGLTRLYLYVHFPTDVLAGAALGVALGAAASAMLDRLAARRADKA